MKNVDKIVLLIVVMLCTGCYDRDIIDSKEFGFSLPEVENLNYTKQGDVVTITWQIPANIPATFRRPVEVSIQIIEDNVYRNISRVFNENTSVNFTIDPNKKNKFIVKLLGFLNSEARIEGKTDRVYSNGRIIEIQ